MYNSEAAVILTEKNLVDLYIKTANISNGEVINHGSYSWAKNDYLDNYSKVFGINIPEENLNTVLKKLCWEIEKGYAPGKLLIGPTARPENIEEILPDYNFEVYYRQTGMAIELDTFDFKCDCDECNIRQVTDEQELGKWIVTVGQAFGQERNETIFKQFLSENDIKFYACYYEGQLVSTTMLFKKGSVASINQVGTLMEYRGKGYATLTVKKALKEAKKLGCTIGVLQASSMGKSIYKAMGFKEYSKISHWEYKI